MSDDRFTGRAGVGRGGAAPGGGGLRAVPGWAAAGPACPYTGDAWPGHRGRIRGTGDPEPIWEGVRAVVAERAAGAAGRGRATRVRGAENGDRRGRGRRAEH